MEEKLYVSKMNYYPGKDNLTAGTVFTAEQWELAGGKVKDLEIHVKKGYITEAVQEVPENLVSDQVEEAEKAEKAEKADQVEEAEEAEPTKPEGIWNYDAEQLEDLPLEVINTIYKQRADEFDIRVRPFTNKEKLIEKMCSEKA